MFKESFDLDAALAELRAEAPSPEARLRVRRALSWDRRVALGGASPAWRLGAIAGGLTVLALPLILKSRDSGAYAIDLARAIDASRAAPYVIVRSYKIEPDGVRTLNEELLYAPHARVERIFFSPQSLREIRHLPGLTFERDLFSNAQGFRPYETLKRTAAPPQGTKTIEAFDRFETIQKHIGNFTGLVRLSDEGPAPDGERRVRFRLGLTKGDYGVWTLAMPSMRILRTEVGDQATEYEYPASIPSDRLDVPPVGWRWPDDFRHLAFRDPGPLPRYDLDRERTEMDRLNADGDRTMVVRGKRVKLVGVFQEATAPGMPVYVAYEGKGLARAEGLRGGGLTTMKTVAPKVFATVFEARRFLKALDVEIPVDGSFVPFKRVAVRQVSPEIRSGLRTPPFD